MRVRRELSETINHPNKRQPHSLRLLTKATRFDYVALRKAPPFQTGSLKNHTRRMRRPQTSHKKGKSLRAQRRGLETEHMGGRACLPIFGRQANGKGAFPRNPDVGKEGMQQAHNPLRAGKSCVDLNLLKGKYFTATKPRLGICCKACAKIFHSEDIEKGDTSLYQTEMPQVMIHLLINIYVFNNIIFCPSICLAT